MSDQVSESATTTTKQTIFVQETLIISVCVMGPCLPYLTTGQLTC